ncbi:hypothetical protein P7C70_g7007, partial [Phenoliferia sp. Uapishka_3]
MAVEIRYRRDGSKDLLSTKLTVPVKMGNFRAHLLPAALVHPQNDLPTWRTPCLLSSRPHGVRTSSLRAGHRQPRGSDIKGMRRKSVRTRIFFQAPHLTFKLDFHWNGHHAKGESGIEFSDEVNTLGFYQAKGGLIDTMFHRILQRLWGNYQRLMSGTPLAKQSIIIGHVRTTLTSNEAQSHIVPDNLLDFAALAGMYIQFDLSSPQRTAISFLDALPQEKRTKIELQTLVLLALVRQNADDALVGLALQRLKAIVGEDKSLEFAMRRAEDMVSRFSATKMEGDCFTASNMTKAASEG